ncbi:MAG: bifunctional DNA primase/polymerase [Alphaproteobacteria bacterium]|nr:bifunctional DNA primase/polymerase [Alphaproteobacteria bacterium]
MTMLNLALSYIKRGLPVFPLVPRSKVPLISKAKGGSGCLDATCDTDKILRWWTDCPDANIGLATGAASGIDVLDVDPRHNGHLSLNTLVQKHDKIGKTPIVQTGGGGLHFLFRHREGMSGSVGLIGEGLDVRADGNYVAAVGSIHESGNAYEWKPGLSLDDVPLADWPNWLSQMVMSNKDSRKAASPEHWREMIAQGVQEGGRNNAVTKLAGHLLGKKVDPHATLDLMLIWNQVRCHPPMDEEEVFQIVENVAEREFKKRMGRRP